MDIATARNIIAAQTEKKPSEIASAVDVLYQAFGTYQAMTQHLGKSEKFWMMRHRISGLPSGIRWKIDEGVMSIGHGYQIARLKSEADQWVLAIAIVEAKYLTAHDCGKVVSLVLNEEMSIRGALRSFADIRFDDIHPLSLPLGTDIWTDLCKIAWTRHQKWEDVCYQFVRQGVDVDLKKVAAHLEKLAADLRHSSEE